MKSVQTGDVTDREKKKDQFSCANIEICISIFIDPFFSFFSQNHVQDRYRIDAFDAILHNGERVTKYYVDALKKKKNK